MVCPLDEVILLQTFELYPSRKKKPQNDKSERFGFFHIEVLALFQLGKKIDYKVFHYTR